MGTPMGWFDYQILNQMYGYVKEINILFRA